MLSVPAIWHASGRNVRILVRDRVVLVPYALLLITLLFAHVQKAIQEIHLVDAIPSHLQVLNRLQRSLAIHHLVDQILFVQMAHVLVYQITKGIHMLAVIQSAFLIQIVTEPRPASGTNVMIPAQERVDKVLVVMLLTTYQYAAVQRERLVMLLSSAGLFHLHQ